MFRLESRRGEGRKEFFDRAFIALVDPAIDAYQKARADGLKDLAIVAHVYHAAYPESHLVLFDPRPRSEYAGRFADNARGPLGVASTAEFFGLIIQSVDHDWLLDYPVKVAWKGTLNPPGVERN